MRLVEVSDGFVEREWCPKAHAGYVVEGAIEFTFADRTERFAQGDGFVISARDADKHKAKSLAPRTLLFMIEEATGRA